LRNGLSKDFVKKILFKFRKIILFPFLLVERKRLGKFLVENLWAILGDKLEDVKLSKIQSLKRNHLMIRDPHEDLEKLY